MDILRSMLKPISSYSGKLNFATMNFITQNGRLFHKMLKTLFKDYFNQIQSWEWRLSRHCSTSGLNLLVKSKLADKYWQDWQFSRSHLPFRKKFSYYWQHYWIVSNLKRYEILFLLLMKIHLELFLFLSCAMLLNRRVNCDKMWMRSLKEWISIRTER